MAVSGKFHTPAALSSLSIEQDAGGSQVQSVANEKSPFLLVMKPRYPSTSLSYVDSPSFLLLC
jgi:hypothetical protein